MIKPIRDWVFVGAPIVALILLGFFGAIFYAQSVSRAHDDAAAAREHRLVSLALQREEDSIKLLATDYAEWNDAYDNMVRRFDPHWADTNFWPTAFDYLAVYDETGALVYERNSPTVLERFGARMHAGDLLGKRAKPLLLRAQAAFDAGRGPVKSFELTASGRLISVAATPIHAATEKFDAPRRLYLFAINSFDDARLAELGTSADIDAVSFTAANAAPPAGFLATPLRNGEAEPIGEITWRQAHPGEAIANAQAPLLAGFFLLLGAAACAVIRLLGAARVRASEEARLAAESANVAKSQFLANMSHELRTPLHAIIGYSEILIEDSEAAFHHAARDDLERVHAASQHLLSLVNDILDLSKVESGALEAHARNFDLERLLDEVAATAKPLFAQGGNEFSCLNVSGITKLETDMRFLRQILLNLLANAAKFTHDGQIRLCVEREENGMLAFHVIDNGVGMTSTQLAKLFNPYIQTDSAIAIKFGGTGLGLALSRNLARLLGGDIVVSSAPGEGSTFSLVFPLRAVAPGEAESASAVA